jgi:hypothetical protein
MFINGSEHVTIRNSRFRDCALYDIFVQITGGDAATIGQQHLTIENNWFDVPWDEDQFNPRRSRMGAVELSRCEAAADGFRHLRIRNNSFHPDTGLSFDIVDACVFDDISVTGNILGWTGDCDGRVHFAGNLWEGSGPGARCSLSDATGSPPYVSRTSGPSMDFHLAGPSIADGLVPIANCPPTDVDGQPRSGASCDAGSDER